MLKKIHLHRGDLPEGLDLGPVVAVDSETMGLNPWRDRLCLVQLSKGDGVCHLVQFGRGAIAAPRLAALLTDPKTLKLFHFARFDLAIFERNFGQRAKPIYCTKVASKLVRTMSDKHGLKDLCRELLGVDLSKQQQTSDWGAETLSEEQKVYAASDVLHLHALKEKLDALLEREGRQELARACFEFIPYRSALDLAGWAETDIFAH
ncbi:MAG: ribonuclease D [Alphaproteobacteria bacterium]